MLIHWLPAEIWIIVFRWATYPPNGYPASHYEPFRTPLETLDESLRTKRALVQVCRLWRALATVFLYEDLRIGYDPMNLTRVLADNHLVGRSVHRLELPYAHTVTKMPSDTCDVVQILRSCPCLKVLVRPYSSESFAHSAGRYEFPANTVSLPSLTRLDWWHDNNAARSGGINSLVDVLLNAPSLRYLTLGGNFWTNAMRLDVPLRLPALTTLHLRRMNALFIWQIGRWELPALVHVVADFPSDNGALEELWLRFGNQLCTVEFGRNLAFHLTDNISILLRGCPSMKVFNYYLNFTAPPDLGQLAEQSSLESVGVHAFPCAMLIDTSSWWHLKRHFEFLSSHFLPALKRIVLYGDWQDILEDSRVSLALKRLEQKGCIILPADHLTSSPCDHS